MSVIELGVPSNFHIWPEPTQADIAAAKAVLKDHGQTILVVKDQNGMTLVGKEVEIAAKDLGMETSALTILTRDFASLKERIEFVICARPMRVPTTKEKRYAIRQALVYDARIANNWLAKKLGCSNGTVNSVRNELEADGTIQRHEKRKGADGKDRKGHYVQPEISDEGLDQLLGLSESPATDAHKSVQLFRGAEAAQAQQRATRFNRKDAHRTRVPIRPRVEDVKLFHCPFRDLPDVAGIKAESVRYFCTDIPWQLDWAKDNLDELAEMAQRLLSPGGIFSTYSGTMNLPQIYSFLSGHLDYFWTIGIFLKRGPIARPHAFIREGWRGVPVFSKGHRDGFAFFDRIETHNAIEGGGQSKTWHKWGQPLSEAERLIEIFTRPGDLVVDPCAGGFTTAVACLRLGRRYIGCDKKAENVSKGQERLRQEFEALERAWRASDASLESDEKDVDPDREDGAGGVLVPQPS